MKTVLHYTKDNGEDFYGIYDHEDEARSAFYLWDMPGKTGSTIPTIHPLQEWKDDIERDLIIAEENMEWDIVRMLYSHQLGIEEAEEMYDIFA